MLEEQPVVRDENTEKNSKSTDNRPKLEIVADSNIGESDGNFVLVREIEERNVAKQKTGHEQLKEMMNQCIERWHIGNNMKVADLRNGAPEEIANSELEDDLIFSDDGFRDDDSFFYSDDENKLDCLDADVFFRTF